MSTNQSITVTHNVEMGHRLSLQPDSKCFHLHGHSWLVELEIFGPLDEKGMVAGLNFGDVKHVWRGYLDTYYDHHLCLNEDDPLVKVLNEVAWGGEYNVQEMWGITVIGCDPTVENMASTWGNTAREMFGHELDYYIKVREAATNAATWRSTPR